MFSFRFQTGRCLRAVEEKWVTLVTGKTFAQCRTYRSFLSSVSASGVSGQQRHDATDAVCISPIPQYWDSSDSSLQRSGQVSALRLLDLTTAFDTVDHQLLLHRHEHQFGLRGVVLAWFASYLTNISFRFLLDGDNMSAKVSVLCSVPQGSVLWPWLFVLYMVDLTDVVDQHNVKFHGCAIGLSDVCTLSASWLSIHYLSSRSLRCWHWPLNGSKSSADESHQDRVAVSRL